VSASAAVETAALDDLSGAAGSKRPGRLRRPHSVMFAIDQLRQLGGAERMLFEIVRRLDPDRFNATIVTFDLLPELDLPAEVRGKLLCVPLQKTYNWHAIHAAVELRKHLRQRQAEIFHSFFETSDLWAAPIARLSGCPILVSSRRDMGILRKRKHALAYPAVNPLFNKILAVSEQVRRFVIEHDKVSPSRVEVLYNGIDLDCLALQARAYSARDRYSIDPQSALVTCLANVRTVKGLDVLVRAAAIVIREIPHVQFVVAGKVLEAATMDALALLTKTLNLGSSFRFLGPVENPFPLLRESDLYVLPSRSEGFSNSLLEAMASGLPCVATDVGGNAEALTDGHSGFLVKSEDYLTMADRILSVLRDKQRAREMGTCAHNVVRLHFSLSAVVDRLMEIYDELLGVRHD